MSKPATSTVPLVGGIKPVIIFIVVDFPAPLGPRNPSISPCSTEKVKDETAGKSPKFLVMSETSINLLLNQ